MSEYESIINLEKNTEIWGAGPPKMGDHIRVKRVWGIYAHHGVYVSDDEVIHFAGQENDSIFDWSKPEVIVTDLEVFLRGGVLEVKEYTDNELDYLYPPEEIVKYARACVGDKGYNLVFNNCEHFATECTLGLHRSMQVNDFISGKKENKKMGPKGRYVYEPDKVRIAEIEAETERALANKERERIELAKQAKIDILQFETQSQLDIERARTEGNLLLMQALIDMQEKMNVIAQKRLEIIENGSLSIIKDIENFYKEIQNNIESKNDDYNNNKLPKLLEQLEKYEPGSSSHKLYEKRINDDMDSQKKYYEKQIDEALNRQNIIISGLIESKDKVLLQNTEISIAFMKTTKEYAKRIATERREALPLKNKE